MLEEIGVAISAWRRALFLLPGAAVCGLASVRLGASMASATFDAHAQSLVLTSLAHLHCVLVLTQLDRLPRGRQGRRAYRPPHVHIRRGGRAAARTMYVDRALTLSIRQPPDCCLCQILKTRWRHCYCASQRTTFLPRGRHFFSTPFVLCV